MGRPMGCTLAFANPSDPTALCCNERVNKMVRPFSEGLPSMLNQLKSNVTGACFFVTNDFEFLADLKSNPNNKYGEHPELMLKCFLSSKIETCFIEFYFIFFAFEGITNTMDATTRMIPVIATGRTEATLIQRYVQCASHSTSYNLVSASSV